MEMKHSAARRWVLVMFAMAAAITMGAEEKPEKTANQEIGIIMTFYAVNYMPSNLNPKS